MAPHERHLRPGGDRGRLDANTARSVRPADGFWRGPTGLALERFLLGELVYLVRDWVADGHVDRWL